MAFEVYDDYEQGERVRQWLRQNGLSIIVGVGIGLVCIFAWQQWRSHQDSRQLEAAELYQRAQQALAAGREAEADPFIERLQKDHADNGYAPFAVSQRAVRQLQAGHADQAMASLQWAEDHFKDPALKHLTALRMAQVELADGKAADALARIDAVGAEFPGLAQELRGDALSRLKRPDEARQAYQAAMTALDEQAPQRNVLQMKIDDLATAGKQGA